MYNWSVDENTLKQDPKRYAIWKLEQQVNFGLGGEKISEKELRTYWSDLKLDSARRRFLSLLLFGSVDYVPRREVRFFRRLLCAWLHRLCLE